MLNAREELKVVEHDRDELDTKRIQTLKDLEIVRAKTRKLRDQAAKKLSNTEQKEILSLLLKNFEFEMRNIEIQAELFKRDFKLREQDMVILRLEQHRSLCDTLILQQRRLIVENNLSLPSDLDELYNLYSRDTTEGQLVKDLSSLRSNSNASIYVSNSPKPMQNTFLTQIQEETGGSGQQGARAAGQNKFLKNKPKGNAGGQAANSKNFYFISGMNQNGNNASNGVCISSFLKFTFFCLKLAWFILKQVAPSPLALTGKHHRNNMSNLSSSSNDTEIIVENGSPTTTHKQMIRTPPRSHAGQSSLVSNQPGQVVVSGQGATATTGDPEAKRATINIAAVAAQKKAKQHHKELMQELDDSGGNLNLNSFLMTSKEERMALEKKNSVLTDGSSNTSSNNNNNNNSNKVKKQVKIKDVVQYKLPDENFDNWFNEENVSAFFFLF